MESVDKSEKAAAKKVLAALAKVPYCPADYNCTGKAANDEDCVVKETWDKCRCSGNDTNDRAGCICDSSLCDKTAAGKVTSELDLADIVDMQSSTVLYFNYVVLEASKEFDFANLGTPRWKVREEWMGR